MGVTYEKSALLTVCYYFPPSVRYVVSQTGVNANFLMLNLQLGAQTESKQKHLPIILMLSSK